MENIEKKCLICGKKFSTRYRNKTFCSTECSNVMKQRTLEENKRERNEYILKTNNEGGKLIKCVVCGKEIRRKYIKNNRGFWGLEKGFNKYCSKECRKRLEKERKKGKTLDEKYAKFEASYEETFEKFQKSLDELLQEQLRITEQEFNDRMRTFVRKCSWLLNEYLGMFSRELVNNITHPEQEFINLTKKNNLPFEYVGNKALIIGGINPDFVRNDGHKQVIEIFGDYWHKPEDENIRREIFKKQGYDMLVIWEHEILKDTDKVLEKVKEFIKLGKRVRV